MDEIEIAPSPPERFDDVLDDEARREWAEVLATGRIGQGDRTLWHVNSTAQGGGVAEMLGSILGYLVGAGLRCRWLVIGGDDDFFVVTKQLHHLLHGESGEDGGLTADAREIYERTLAPEIERITALVEPGDTVVLHDPQPLGLAPALKARGAHIVWACHIGADEANDYTREAWQFLMPYVEHTDRQVFSRSAYAWDCLDTGNVAIIPPCLDAFSPKNQHLDDEVVISILVASGVIDADSTTDPAYTQQDGSSAVVTARADVAETARLHADTPIVTQISRWDVLKDHVGVMRAFIDHVDTSYGVHLVLAGPSPESVADDPEGGQVITELRAAWDALPDDARARVHVVCLPMDDLDENAAIVNALQRQSTVVVQKSLAEGFGLTVAEAMWKARPTIGSRLGGIQDQIVSGESGLLVDDPTDPAEVGAAITTLLADPDLGRRLGEAAKRRVCDDYLAPCNLTRYLQLIDTLTPMTDDDAVGAGR